MYSKKWNKGFFQLCESQTIKKVILNNYAMWKYTSVFLLAIFVLIFCDRVFTHFATTEKCKLRKDVEKVRHNKKIVVVCTIINVFPVIDKIIQLKDQMYIWMWEIFSKWKKLKHYRSLHLSYKSFDPFETAGHFQVSGSFSNESMSSGN